MSLHLTKIDGLATGAVANTYITLASLKFADTAGHRGRLRRLILSGGGGSPQDLQVSIKIQRTDNNADGTSSAINVNTIAQKDALTAASNVAAIGSNFTVEPSNKATAVLGGGSFNTRSGLVLEWGPDEAPIWGRNQTLVIQGAPGTATAANLQAELLWEEGF